MNLLKRKKKEVDPRLIRACAQNLPLDLRITGPKRSTLYRSRFLSLDDDSRNPRVIIEAPTSEGSVVPIRPKQKARAFFSINGQNLAFLTSVAGRGKFELNPQLTVPSLELFAPEEVSSGERRAFYRILMNKKSPIEVKLGIFSDDPPQERRLRSREKALMTDIGGGGIGFRMPEGRSLLLGPDTYLTTQFRLPRDESKLTMAARVCFSVRRPDLREAYFGVQFVEIDKEISRKQSVDKILRFVAERQRQLLNERARGAR